MNLKETIGKGTIELVLLSLLSREDMYGYQIIQTISDVSDGLLSINIGALYTTFYRMEEEGYIVSREEVVKKRQKRIYYHLTDSGREYYVNLMKDYCKLQAALNQLLGITEKAQQKE